MSAQSINFLSLLNVANDHGLEPASSSLNWLSFGLNTVKPLSSNIFSTCDNISNSLSLKKGLAKYPIFKPYVYENHDNARKTPGWPDP